MWEICCFYKKCSLILWFLPPLRIFLIDFTLRIVWHLVSARSKCQLTLLHSYSKMKMSYFSRYWIDGLKIFRKYSLYQFKKPWNIWLAYLNWYRCHAKGLDTYAPPCKEKVYCFSHDKQSVCKPIWLRFESSQD